MATVTYNNNNKKKNHYYAKSRYDIIVNFSFKTTIMGIEKIQMFFVFISDFSSSAAFMWDLQAV